MNEFLEGLSAQAGAAVRGLLQQAYERGYREALASAGSVASPGKPEAQRAVDAEEPAPAQESATAPASPQPAPVAWAEVDDDADEEPDDEPREAADAPVVRPILPNATVATLRKRIVRTFDLERFDIDVVVCRAGDRDRRQLKGSTRLGVYRREE